MRSYAIDTTRVRMISTGKVSEVQKWVVLGDGSRRPDPTGRQEIDGQGRPLWRVEVIVPADEGDERDKTDVTEVVVAAHERPNGGAFGDLLRFEKLTMTPGYVNRKTGQLTPVRWAADGVHGAGTAGKPAPTRDAA
jgi:hypothetical protein